MDNIQKILEETFHKTGWLIEKPKEGWEKTSFIASLEDEKYFIKLGTNKRVMNRLNTLNVIPKIISAGNEYVIQEFIQESFIDRAWLINNLSTLAEFLKIYHEDEKLLHIVSESVSKDKLTISAELEMFLARLNKLPKKYEDVENGIKKLQELYRKIDVALFPVHDDPNYKNIFLHKGKLLMIDWNTIRLSDVLSDIGAILWWYVPEEKWKEFFDAYGMKFDNTILERIYLAAAKMSLGFTLWCLENNVDYTFSFTDFQEAINHRPNPHAWYKK